MLSYQPFSYTELGCNLPILQVEYCVVGGYGTKKNV